MSVLDWRDWLVFPLRGRHVEIANLLLFRSPRQNENQPFVIEGHSPQQCDCPQLLAGSALLTGRKHDGRIRVTRRPRGKPPAGPFNVSGPTLGRSEMPQPIGHSCDLAAINTDLAMFCCRQRRHDGFLFCRE
jgi:hypothetical protein